MGKLFASKVLKRIHVSGIRDMYLYKFCKVYILLKDHENWSVCFFNLTVHAFAFCSRPDVRRSMPRAERECYKVLSLGSDHGI